MKEFDFQILDVYKKAKSFHKLMKSFISENKLERYEKDQLGRASFSVILNIAEGSSRFSKPDRKHFFVVARGSLFECVAVLDELHEENLIESIRYESFLNDADELSRMLYSMIMHLS
jgi:four helix bundle protein